MDRDRSHSMPLTKRVSGSLLLVLKLDDDFDGDINDTVCCFIHNNLTSITGYFEQTIPDIYHLTSNTTFESKDEKNIPNSLGK